jgi:hypothetical protein
MKTKTFLFVRHQLKHQGIVVGHEDVTMASARPFMG